MDLERTEAINHLADRYLVLLNDRQRELVQMYFADDYSLAEIAEIYSISRQAVHDGLQRSIQALERYEESLHLCAAEKQTRAEIAEMQAICTELLSHDLAPHSEQLVHGLMQRLKEL